MTLFRTMLAFAVAAPALANTDWPIRQVTETRGEMYTSVAAMRGEIMLDDTQVLVFEPFQMIEEFFGRDDLVYLMRHGKTDWSVRDAHGVAPQDCDNQRLMTPEGAQEMRNLGLLLGHYGLEPGAIFASEWCRNQQTLASLLEGVALAAPERFSGIEVTEDAGMNLLLSLGGAETAAPIDARIDAFVEAGAEGPLMLLTHYTNIEEFSDFRVYEGEILVVDPTRDNRVLGYLRLKSAGPDIGHFPDAEIPRR